LRIGSSFPDPKDHRMLITWLIFRDLAELVRCCLYAPKLAHGGVWRIEQPRPTLVGQQWRGPPGLPAAGQHRSLPLQHRGPGKMALRRAAKSLHGRHVRGGGAVSDVRRRCDVSRSCRLVSPAPRLSPHHPGAKPSNRTALSFKIPGITSGLKPATSKSFIQRSGVISG